MPRLVLACLIATLPSAALAQDAKTPCDGPLAAADFSGLLVGTPKLNRYSMSQQKAGDGCEMGVSTDKLYAFVDIAVSERPAGFYKNLLAYTPHKPLAGVGDEAANMGTADGNAPGTSATAVYARKGSLVCMAELDRSKDPAADKLVVPMPEEALAGKLGALCAKLFAG